MAERFDERTRRTALLHDQVRQVLIDHFGQTPQDELATALAYEVASLVAVSSDDIAAAIKLLDTIARMQLHQIALFGVGRPHP